MSIEGRGTSSIFSLGASSLIEARLHWVMPESVFE